MSEYSSLKATINASVKTNGNQEITGSIMNSVLNAMVDSLGTGYQFIGVATPTNPGSAQTPDYKCFYLATTPGTYANLGGLVVADGEVVLLKYDTSWTKEVTGIASADKLNQLDQEVFGINEMPEYLGNIETTYIDTSSTAKYKVIQVKGGEHLFVESTTYTRVAILSEFTYNPTTPYNLIFATGETARRQVQGSFIEVDLPNDARYVLLQTVYDYGVGRVTIKKLYLDGISLLYNVRKEGVELVGETETPYFSTDKTFGLTNINDIYALRNALIKCVWYSQPVAERIGVFSYQLAEGQFLLWFANCDALADDDVITSDKVFAIAQGLYSGDSVQRFDIMRGGVAIGYVVVDIDLMRNYTGHVSSSTPTTYKNSAISIKEIDMIQDALNEANLALKQSSPVSGLDWSVRLIGQDGSYITPKSDIVLSNDGDSLEFQVSNVQSPSMDNGGYAFTKGTAEDVVRGIFINQGGLAVRSDDGTWVFNSIVADSSNRLKVKLEYSNGNILLYLNDILHSTYTGQKTLTIKGFGNGVVSQYPTYWSGIIDSIQYNTNQLSFFTDFYFGIRASLYRSIGFLTDEQAELLGGNSNDLYASKTANVLNLYKKLPDGKFVKYPLEYRQRSFVEGQYPSFFDNWGIGKPRLCDFNGKMIEQVDLFSGAEAELALTTPDARDGSFTYVGGAMHGFENIIVGADNIRNIMIYVNGILIREQDEFALMPIEYAEIIQKTSLCPAYTNENPFAEVLKHWNFDRDGLRIKTSISVTRSVTFRQTMMGMFGVLRHWNGIVTNDYLTNRATKNNIPFRAYDVKDGWEDIAANTGLKNRDKDCTEIKLYGDRGLGFALRVQSDGTKQTGGMFVSTNGGQEYNKTYFDLTGADTSLNSGDTLEATQHWVIE